MIIGLIIADGKADYFHPPGGVILSGLAHREMAMDVLHDFLSKQGRAGDVIRFSGEILELIRSTAGLYVRIVQKAENRFDLSLVTQGGARPKQVWYDGNAKILPNLSRGEIRERCEKCLRA
jgi:hypothetical protein